MAVVRPGDDTVELGGDPNCPWPSCPWFSLAADGVVGPDPGIGGRLSSKDAPNDDDGLKVFNPVNVPKPVVCEASPPVRWTEIDGSVEVVAPVGWVETEENIVSEKLLFVVDVIWGDSVFVAGLLFPKFNVVNSEAMFDMVEPALGLDMVGDICSGCPF